MSLEKKLKVWENAIPHRHHFGDACESLSLKPFVKSENRKQKSLTHGDIFDRAWSMHVDSPVP
jgi:hypothetical protein